MALRDNLGDCFITETGLRELSSKVERPLLENPGEQLLEDADEQTKIEVIRRALEQNLAARDRRFIDSHFGIGCEEKALAEMASEEGVSYHFVKGRLDRVFLPLRGHIATR